MNDLAAACLICVTGAGLCFAGGALRARGYAIRAKSLRQLLFEARGVPAAERDLDADLIWEPPIPYAGLSALLLIGGAFVCFAGVGFIIGGGHGA